MTTGKQRILLIEDNDEAREAMVAVLELWDLAVDAVCDGSQALILAGANPYSAVLVDLSIPEPNGYAVARQIKASTPASRLIAVTGLSGATAEKMALSAGFDHFLTKPVDLDHLSRLLKEVGSQAGD